MAQADHSRPQLGINGYGPRGPFVEFHNRPNRWAVMVCHRRAGKTVACVADLILSALLTRKQDARYAYLCPQYNQAKDVAWKYVKQLTADIPGVQYNETELRADLPNGARIRLYGADNPDRLRGLYLDGVVLDEYADMRYGVWGEVLRPALSDRKGWAVFIGTPKGPNAFHKLWKETEGHKDWYRLMLRASESGLVDADELADAQQQMTDDQYAQEYECSFEAAIQGAYYGKEIAKADKDGRIRTVEYDPILPVFTAWDIGYSDDTTIVFYQVTRGEVRIIDYYAASGQGVAHYVEVLNAKPYSYFSLGDKPCLFLPHDARAKTFASGGKSTQEQFAALGYNSRIVPELSLQDGIQAVRMMLPRTYIDKDNCLELLDALRLYRREWDGEKKVFRDKPLHDWTSHAADAMRYCAVMYREASGSDEPKQPPKFAIEDGRMNITLDELWAETTTREERI